MFRMATEEDDFVTHSEEYLERQKDILDEKLRPQHARSVKNFLHDKEGDLSAATARNYARELRFLIGTSYDLLDYGDDISEWDTADWTELIRETARQRDIGDGTKRNTVYAAKKLIRHFEDSEAEADEIDAPKITHSDIDPETVLSVEDVVELIETTERDRDAAIIALLYEGALRRTALIQLDVKHYITDNFTRIKIPDRSGVKTGQYRERPLNWSAGYIDSWLTDHPQSDDPDAPLFVSIRSQDSGERLSSHSIYTMVKRVAEKSDIDADRVHPHAFRHSRVTTLRGREDITKSDIETILGWTDSTPMHDRYSHTTSTEEAKTTALRMGVEIEDTEETQVIEECPRCNQDIPRGSSYCPSCTLPISEEQPEWWNLYRDIAPEDDPLRDQYKDQVTAVPRIHQMQIQEIERVYNVFIGAEQLMYEEGSVEMPAEFKGLSEFESEENASSAMEIIRDDIRPRISTLAENQNLELLKDSLDVGNIESIVEKESE